MLAPLLWLCIWPPVRTNGAPCVLLRCMGMGCVWNLLSIWTGVFLFTPIALTMTINRSVTNDHMGEKCGLSHPLQGVEQFERWDWAGDNENDKPAQFQGSPSISGFGRSTIFDDSPTYTNRWQMECGQNRNYLCEEWIRMDIKEKLMRLFGAHCDSRSRTVKGLLCCPCDNMVLSNGRSHSIEVAINHQLRSQ